MKKIAVFFDGTWNRADQHTRDGQPCPTNVVKLFEATLPVDENNRPQIAHYVQGVGTRRSERISGGGFGYGISDNIKDGYRFLASNYQPGDEIYIVGFSRGAYTARSLAGMIRNIGILKREKLFLVDEAFDHYRDRSAEWHPDGTASIAFRDEHTWGNETIRYLGVFDTVGALGAPFGIVLGRIVDWCFKCSFHDTKLSSIVLSAYHALAVDERRLPFLPTLMQPNKQHTGSNFEQKWFPGVHSNVGGGYPTTGLSDLALAWMAENAKRHGLGIDLGKVSNPSVKPNVCQAPKSSQTIGYRLATLFTVKIPGLFGISLKKYREALPQVRWNGDYLRPIPAKGTVSPYIGNPPQQPADRYQGTLHPCVIEKINSCWSEYQPPNVL